MDIPQIRRLKTKLLLLMEMHEEMGGGKEEKMSVLVKGVEMPKCCDECPLLDEYCICSVTGEKVRLPFTFRAYECPLEEVEEDGEP